MKYDQYDQLASYQTNGVIVSKKKYLINANKLLYKL